MPESVMVVEDEGLVALELQECLRQMGYKVPAVAVTGAEAVARAAELRPDLVLMDIRLKGEMDGIEAARQIMDCQAIPVVYLTAHSDDATVRRARETAPFGYVLKPWEEKSLQIAIDMALHKARAEAGIKGERDWYLSILRYAGAPMLVCGTDGTVRFLNASAEQLLGESARSAVGRRLEHVVDLREPSGAATASSLLRGTGGRRLESRQTLFLGTDAAGLPVDVETVPIVGEGGADLGLLVVIRPRAAGDQPHEHGQRGRAVSLDEYLQTELIRLFVLQEQGGEQVDRFVEGELEAYRRLMRDFLGRDLADLGRLDWKEGLVRRAVRDAHEQTKAILMERPDILQAGQMVPSKLERYLQVLCARLAGPNGATQVQVGDLELDVDTAIYCVLIVNEILEYAMSAGASAPVAVRLDVGQPGCATLSISATAKPGESDSDHKATPVLSALVGEINGSLSIASDVRTMWTITFPIADR